MQAKILLLADSSGSPLTDNNNNNNNGESSEVPDSIAGSSKEEPKSTPGTPPGTTVAYTGETKFRLNLQFNTKRIKFKLIVAQQKESPLIVSRFPSFTQSYQDLILPESKRGLSDSCHGGRGPEILSPSSYRENNEGTQNNDPQ